MILFVEDEPLIRELVCMDLSDAGHGVLQAGDADEAMKLLNGRNDINLIITDIDMPGSMNGLELASSVRRGWPPIKIIIASGKHTPRAQDMPIGSVFLPKPYLSRNVFEAMESLAI